MKKHLVCIILSIFIFITACTTEKRIGGERDEHGCLVPAGYSWCESKQKCLRTWEEECPSSGQAGANECTKDNDCVTGGCSGTICQSKDAEPAYTTCEFMPEYECYKKIKCRCLDGKCQWKRTDEFEVCVKEKRNSQIASAG